MSYDPLQRIPQPLAALHILYSIVPKPPVNVPRRWRARRICRTTSLSRRRRRPWATNRRRLLLQARPSLGCSA